MRCILQCKCMNTYNAQIIWGLYYAIFPSYLHSHSPRAVGPSWDYMGTLLSDRYHRPIITLSKTDSLWLVQHRVPRLDPNSWHLIYYRFHILGNHIGWFPRVVQVLSISLSHHQYIHIFYYLFLADLVSDDIFHYIMTWIICENF